MKFFTVLVILLLSVVVRGQNEFFSPTSSIGGYGELHYNMDRTQETRTLDFHRFILFYRHEWTPIWSFNSEVELEHNLVKSGQGELELEQAYVDFHPDPRFGFRAGVVLAPVGIFNLVHEPPTFLSVERPDYAKVIIPTTWFGNGMSFYGVFRDLEYNMTLMEGLDADGFSPESGLRGGRQKGYKANADDLLKSIRLDYTGIAGARVGFSWSINDAYRNDADPVGFQLYELHGRYQRHGIYATAEYGTILYDQYTLPEAEIESSVGYYIDLGYNIGRFWNLNTEIIPWVRWTDYNTVHSALNPTELESQYHYQKWLMGISVKPIDSVVFKLDFAVKTDQLEETDTKLLNLGVGYMF
ncbi:MAG: porin [candidate division KSB1 bacterium]|nr:porin [candidate division KSB1 bacterium]